MKKVCIFFAANRYWPKRERLESVYNEIRESLPGFDEYKLITDSDGLILPDGDIIAAVPLSGAVQKRILDACEKYRCAILYGAYIRGNACDAACDDMMRANAAPTFMDVWAVLKRSRNTAMIALSASDLSEKIAAASAYCEINGANVLLIGHTEPWVVSTPRENERFSKLLSVNMLHAEQDELAQLYYDTKKEDAEPYYRHFTSLASGIKEPSDEDIWNACKMAHALVTLLKKYDAKTAAIACFDLLKVGTSACLGVSFVNDMTDMSIACEGDLDSAITMLIMKNLTCGKLFMANPALRLDGTVNFSHCTAPICCCGENSPCILRSHHESGIGVSPQIDLPIGQRITACRLSGVEGIFTVHGGMTVEGAYEPVCRTQINVKFDDFDHYLETSLGCHQVFAFENIESKAKTIANLLGLKTL